MDGQDPISNPTDVSSVTKPVDQPLSGVASSAGPSVHVTVPESPVQMDIPVASVAPGGAETEAFEIGQASAQDEIGDDQAQNGLSPKNTSVAESSETDEEDKSIAAREFHKRTASIKQGREIIKAREKDVSLVGRLGNLAVPLLFLGVLVLIIVFVFIPFGTGISETREQTKALREQLAVLEAKRDTLEEIDLSDLEDRLVTVSSVVKDDMDVAELAIEVENMAVSHNLDPLTQNMSNQQDLVSQQSEVETGWVPSYAKAISGPFGFSGAFTDVMAFLSELRQESKTIMTLGSLSLSRVQAEGVLTDKWNISLVISGYTSPPATTVRVEDRINTNLDDVLFDEVYRRTTGDLPDEDTRPTGSEE